MSTSAQTYWQSSAEIWEGQRNYSLKNEVDKDAISCSPYEKTGDSRFAPNLLPYIGVRAVFFGVTCAVVRKVYAACSVQHWA